ncbi:glycosyltransferase [Actinoplanes flavus]|uniref:Glycosyltransferase family 1 protein n=1 Tax=Actinoplanes flavus TaxID=2820290 RepID=A0ABS3UVF7_9ACTN|nr:glycosyltransferase [Actinoplanes flavus]MBO3742568.1 glycosyltransferase family 1 protein [Actinoplanes flavus]
MATIVIVGIGTRGDVVPYTALGSALAAGGDRVTIATHASLRSHVDEAGLGFADLPVEFGADRPLSSARFARLLAGRWLDIGEAVLAAARDADLLLLSPMGWLGYHVAQATGAASMGVFLQPLEPTAAFPPPLVTTRPLGAAGNRAAARAFRVLGQLPFARANAEFRRRLGLPPLGPAAMFRQADEQRWPVLHGFSSAVVPVPADWPEHRPVTGYWWPRGGRGLSPELRRFLDDGEPPVFVGFGSLAAPRLRDVVEQTVAGLGRRVIVQAGAAGLTAGHRDVLTIGDEPHHLLFPRTSVVVHHGGAGTTAAALRAGVPSVVVPFTADQPFWARRVAALGAGPTPIPLRRATPRRLRDAIAVADSHRTGAEAVSRQLATEDGIATAVAEIRRRVLPVQ